MDDRSDPFSEYEKAFGKIEREDVAVTVTCPTCHATGIIHVDKDLVSSSPTGVYRYPVEKVTCEHSYIVVIDKNFKSRT